MTFMLIRGEKIQINSKNFILFECVYQKFFLNLRKLKLMKSEMSCFSRRSPVTFKK